MLHLVSCYKYKLSLIKFTNSITTHIPSEARCSAFHQNGLSRFSMPSIQAHHSSHIIVPFALILWRNIVPSSKPASDECTSYVSVPECNMCLLVCGESHHHQRRVPTGGFSDTTPPFKSTSSNTALNHRQSCWCMIRASLLRWRIQC